MHPQFAHIFAGEYAAGYFSYLWSEMLEADVFLRFLKAGMLSANIGNSFRRTMLAPGAGKPGLVLFKEFMGREPDAKALMRKKGIR